MKGFCKGDWDCREPNNQGWVHLDQMVSIERNTRQHKLGGIH